jgi:hypothetical protein
MSLASAVEAPEARLCAISSRNPIYCAFGSMLDGTVEFDTDSTYCLRTGTVRCRPFGLPRLISAFFVSRAQL